MTQPLVFIILVNWNGKDVTLDCLASLQRISYANHRVVVVDNASADGSVDEISRRFPSVQLLKMRENLRFAGGNNAGMRHALDQGAEMILLLNNDTTVAMGFLEPLVSAMQASNDIGMVTPKILYASDPSRIWFAGARISFWTGTMKHLGIRAVDDGSFDIPGPTDYATGCCVLIKRTIVEQVGMLDESFFMYGEDADWSMRVRRAGMRLLYVPSSSVWHKVSLSSGGHLSGFKLRNKFISNFRFFARYAEWYHWLVFPWMNVVVNAVAAVRYLVGHYGQSH